MDKKTILTKTGKGESEHRGITSDLFGDLKRVLALVDNQSTVEELTKRAAPSLRSSFGEILQKLIDDGFIQDTDVQYMDNGAGTAKTADHKSPAFKISTPTAQKKDGGMDLDFTSMLPEPSRNAPADEAAEAARLKAEQEAAEAARLKAEQEAAEAARLKAEQEAARDRAELAAIQAKAKKEAEAKARAESEAARLKASQDAAKARAEAETARLKAEQEAIRAKAELAAAKARAQEEAEAKARAEANKARAEAETARLKAAQEAAAKAQAEAQARAEAEVKAARASATPQVGAVAADEEARQLAESQAKIWANAEQRAKMQAAIQAQQAEEMQRAEKAPPAVKRTIKRPRKPLPLGKISASLFGLSVVLAILLPYVWPMQDYIPQIEKKLSALLQQPVHIGHLRPVILPLPKLKLQDVSVGSKQNLRAGDVTLNFDIFALYTGTRTISSAEVSDLSFSTESFDNALSSIQAAGRDANYPISRIILQGARVNNAALNLPAINGIVDFDKQGNLTKAVLTSVDDKSRVELQPYQSRWQIKLAIKESSLPMVPGLTFNDLDATGEAGTGEAYFHSIQGFIYNGQLLGNMHLTWKKNWQMQGQLQAKSLELGKALPQSGLTGKLDGTANLTLRSAQLASLADDPHLDGRFVVKKGVIDGIDMVETARVAGRQGVVGGRTHFDELSGTLLIDGRKQQVGQIIISAGVMGANGHVDVAPDKQLSGRLNLDLKVRAEMGSLPLTLTGALAKPVWSVGR